MKLAPLAGALCCALSIAACNTDPKNGKETLFGVDLPFSNATYSADVKIAHEDVQAAVNALPGLCNKLALGLSLTQQEVNVLTGAKIPAKTVANIINAGQKGLTWCNGTVAVVSPLIASPTPTVGAGP